MNTVDIVDRPTSEEPTVSRRGSNSAILLGVLVFVGGLLWMLDILNVVDVRFSLMLPIALTVIGIAIIIGSLTGPTPGLIVAAIFVALATLAVALAPQDAFHGGIGDRRITVTDQVDLEERYDLSIGELRLDLSGMTMTQSATIGASVGAGDLIITVPPGVPVQIDAAVGAGSIRFFGQQMGSGISVSASQTSPGFETAPITLTLDLNVAAGEIRVIER